VQYTSGPPGLNLNAEHVALLQQELPGLGRKMHGCMCWSGLPPERLLVFVAHLAGTLGKKLAAKTGPDWELWERLAEAETLGIRPVCVAVEPLDEIAGEMYGDHLVREIQLRPAGAVAIIVVDQADSVGLAFATVDLRGYGS
jgi:hypothetical protein